MRSSTVVLISLLSVFAINANAQDSGQHSGQASKHSALAASEGLASTAVVASAAVAVPVIVVAGTSAVAGSAVVAAGDSLDKSIKASHAHEHQSQTTLVITERTITADPAPNQVIKQPEK
ncbi:hypothetical protein [Aliiglaciecola sp. LCG003]|uniref:hypothetical protein n=1 Tax=Aliiglaciecola sp. LCG003 TaxID=3053655 RepID=UPI0025745527|nr:hypothetical protein [Aliiglaciecola sp. LCG003]WJG10813.1 hypothetical protein QR722_07180 [Aliiglaciecola sp. LCG003]